MLESVKAPPKKKLGELLVEAGVLTREQLEPAIAESRRLGKWLGEYLAAEGLVTPADLAMTLSLQLNVPFIDLKRHTVQPQALQLVSEEYARQRVLIPIDVVGDALVVVMADPGNIQVLEDLKARAKMAIQPAVGIPSDIREAINRSYRASGEIEAQVSRVTPPVTEPTIEEALTPDLVAQTPIVREETCPPWEKGGTTIVVGGPAISILGPAALAQAFGEEVAVGVVLDGVVVVEEGALEGDGLPEEQAPHEDQDEDRCSVAPSARLAGRFLRHR